MEFECWKLVSIRDGSAGRSAQLLALHTHTHTHTHTHRCKHKQRTAWFDLAFAVLTQAEQLGELRCSSSSGCLCSASSPNPPN